MTLPAKLLFTAYGSDWEQYKSALLEAFQRDFMEPPFPEFTGLPVYIDPRPDYFGLPKRLWHCISVGADKDTPEEEREIQCNRCERLVWARPLIELAETKQTPNWITKNGRRYEGYIAVDDFSYVVVLKRSPRDNCWYLATTFCPGRQRRLKFERDWKCYQANNK